jgi:hypothetical protein
MPLRGKTIAELRRELKVKKVRLAKLQSSRAKVSKRLGKLDHQIAVLLGDERKLRGRRKKKARRRVAKKAKRRRRATGKPLGQYISKALAGSEKGMRVKDIQQAVVKAGYRSASKNFYSIVAAALADESKFQRVGRGLYKLAR